MLKIILFIVCLYFVSCSPTDSTNNERLNRLEMVAKTLMSDTTLAEDGIDAVPAGANNNAIQIMWYTHNDVDRLKSFRIYRSTDPQGEVNYNSIATLEILNKFNQDTVYIDQELETDRPYYYFVTVIDKDSRESLPSDTVWYTLLPKAEPQSPSGSIDTPDEINYVFRVPSDAIPNGYILRIEREVGANFIELVYLEKVEPFNDFGEQFVTHTLAGDTVRALFADDLTYRWRVDLIAGDALYSGSESDWETFSVNWGN